MNKDERDIVKQTHFNYFCWNLIGDKVVKRARFTNFGTSAFDFQERCGRGGEKDMKTYPRDAGVKFFGYFRTGISGHLHLHFKKCVG